MTRADLLKLIRSQIAQHEHDSMQAPMTGDLEHYILSVPMLDACLDMYKACEAMLLTLNQEDLSAHPRMAGAVDEMYFAILKARGKRG
jgi:hypothetical protein